MHELPSEPVNAQLAELSWDSEVLVELCPQHIVAILDRYLRSELSAEQVVDWPERIECRDGIGFAHAGAEAIDDAVFTLANGEIHEPLNHEVAQRIRIMLLRTT